MVKEGETNTALRDLQALFEVGAVGGLPDGHLLGRFVSRREPAVFEAIVRRHGPMVWGVCRGVLRDHHDAEDAFQATFLVLARRAPSVLPREKLGPWLYGVAHRTATKARATRARRRAREVTVAVMPEPGAARKERDEDLPEHLDRELSRLPEEYRIVVALCELEGRTHREAAGLLGWPIGTVSGRLSRARAMLAKRLARRGVPPSAGTLAVLLARDAEAASLPTRLIGPTARAASLFAAGGAEAAGVVAPEVVTLVGGVMRMMWLARLKAVVAVVLALGLVATGATALALRSAGRGDQQPAAGGPVKPPQERRNVGDRTPPATVGMGPTADHFEPSLQGTWAVVDVQIGGPQPVDAREVNEVRISSDSITFSYQDRADTLKYRVNRSADPKEIDLIPAKPAAADRNVVYRGIYKQDGDELRIAFTKNQAVGASPPADFGAGSGRGDWLYTLRRREGPDYRGRWQAVRFLIDGKADPAEAVGKTELLLDDASYRFVSAPPFGPRGKGSGEGRTVVDLTKAPCEIDLIPSSGPYEGLTQEGIFEVEGDTLKLCYGMPTKARPTEFATRPNSGIYLAEFRRVAGRAAKDGPGEPGRKPSRKALSGGELSGIWRGEREGAGVEIAFRGDGRATWKVSTRRGDASATVQTDLRLVDDEESGCVLLRFGPPPPLPVGKTSLVMGRLARGADGTLRLTMEPDAHKQSDSYYQLLKDFPLAAVRGEK